MEARLAERKLSLVTDFLEALRTYKFERNSYTILMKDSFTPTKGTWLDDVYTLPGRIKNWAEIEESTGFPWKGNIESHPYNKAIDKRERLHIWAERTLRLNDVCKVLFGKLKDILGIEDGWPLNWREFCKNPIRNIPIFNERQFDIEERANTTADALREKLKEVETPAPQLGQSGKVSFSTLESIVAFLGSLATIILTFLLYIYPKFDIVLTWTDIMIMITPPALILGFLASIATLIMFVYWLRPLQK